MSSPQQSHFIRIELPPDATPEEIKGLEQAVDELVDVFIEQYDYDIDISGGAWYPPEDDSTEPIPVALRNLRTLIYSMKVDNSPTDGALLRIALQALQTLGMSQTDLQIHLECERKVNSVALRNMQVEDNLLAALDMVMGNVGNPAYRVDFQAGTT